MHTLNAALYSHLADSTTLFIITPTSLLLAHSLITDVQQITGRNGQQWINCTSGRDGISGNIYSAVDSTIVSSGVWLIGPERRPANRLYYCLATGSQKYHFSIFLNTLKSSGTVRKCMTYCLQRLNKHTRCL